jgi:hypothetical protein
MHSISAHGAITTGAPAAAWRLAWPMGAKEARLPAKPMPQRDTPALIWRALMRRSWWRWQRGLRPQPVPRPLWC